ncbi:hypothetical protein [Haloflavibacter putidus]|uniref:MG2 domain-containing protein n=1 Tax=Haloflavibacter putidus TaxID=2576776 RepID=A0A507ZN57_9FLAO|nr:hypothetical protein [Haloflavibacter putidus]TQD37674.1 hypothetical protein FKR84_09380 [Haloflavibacter putidus]
MHYILQKTTILLILGCTMLSAKAQDNQNALSNVKEKVYVSVNNQTLLAGENLRYNFFNLNTKDQTFSTISKIGYVELVNTDGEVLKKQAIDLEHSVGSGSIYIPTNTPSGNYKLLGYTRWMLNKPVSELFQTDIFIINPFQTPKQELVSGTAQDSVRLNETQLKPITSTYLQVNFSKDKFKPREEVKLNLEAFKNMQVSISVKKVDGLSLTKSISPKDFSNAENTQNSSNAGKSILPEIRGQLISGHISGPKVAEKKVALSIPGGESSQTKLVNTDKQGKFYFNLDQYPTHTTTYIEVFAEDRQAYTISLDSIEIKYKNLEFRKPTLLHSSMQETIEARSVALQIQNAYFEYKKDSILSNLPTQPFYEPFKKAYNLDEYKRFSTLAETLIEIPNELYARKQDGKYNIYLRDRDNFTTTEVYGSSLVLFNGAVVQNTNRLFELPASNIKKIEFVNKGYVFGPRIFSGVVNFVNKDFNYELEVNKKYRIKTNLNRPAPKKVLNQPNYATANNLNKIPDYRYELYWEPTVQLPNESRDFMFFTADVNGTFKVSIEGFTENGQPILVEKYFEVKN